MAFSEFNVALNCHVRFPESYVFICAPRDVVWLLLASWVVVYQKCQPFQFDPRVFEVSYLWFGYTFGVT